jgi:hypothetical protein
MAATCVFRAQVGQLRNKHKIKVEGSDVPEPMGELSAIAAIPGVHAILAR